MELSDSPALTALIGVILILQAGATLKTTWHQGGEACRTSAATGDHSPPPHTHTHFGDPSIGRPPECVLLHA